MQQINPYLSKKPLAVGIKLMAKGFLSSLFIWFEFVLEHFDQSVAKCLCWDFCPCLRKMENVQISQELFMQLLRFHLVEDESCEKEIKQGLEKKLDRMVMRDLYGKFKTAPTEEERERARKEYLDRQGVPENFRW